MNARPIEMPIDEWKDCRRGETAWILGSGPSLDEMDPNIVGVNVFALNLTILMRYWRYSWWICRDGRCFGKWFGSDRDMGEDRRDVDTLFTDFAGFKRARSINITNRMLRQIVNTQQRFFTGDTVLVYALQVADYMGFSEIILAGIDLCDPGGSMYAKEIDWQHKGTISARPGRFRKMRREVQQVSTSINARVLTVSPHLEDIFEKARI